MNKAEREFIAGMQNIERKIIQDFKNKSITLSASNILWNSGKDIFPIPSKVLLEISLGGKKIEAYFSQEQLEDSWDLISRSDVKSIIKQILRSFT